MVARAEFEQDARYNAAKLAGVTGYISFCN
jgi:hypothetical protein